MSKTIVAGHISSEALKFLQEHGAVIESALGLSIIELSKDAEVSGPRYVHNEYTIQWTDEEDNDPLEWIEVELYLDAYDTRVKLKTALTILSGKASTSNTLRASRS